MQKNIIFSSLVLLIVIISFGSAEKFGYNIIDQEGIVNVNISSPLEVNGAIPVNIQDQTTRTLDLYFSENVSGPYFLSTNTTPNNRVIQLVNATGLNAGDLIGLFQDSDDPKSYFATIDSISGDNITMKEPVDQIFNSLSPAVLFELENQILEDCSQNEVIHSIDNDASIPIDITRIIWSITTDSIPDLNEFGDISGGLDKGLLLRIKRSNGEYYNIFTFRTNKDFQNFAYDYSTNLASNPAQAVNGLVVRSTFAGQEKHGVVIRLHQNESLELLCQDDLSSLLTFQVLAQGHFTQN